MGVFNPCSAALFVMCFLLVAKDINSQGPNGYFLQFGDAHPDPTYGSRYESCRYRKDPQNAGKYGDFGCDPPMLLMESTIAEMKNKYPNPDFILWMGDSGWHPVNRSDSLLNPESLVQLVQNITDLLKRTFPGVQVIPMMGNHDWNPSNQLPYNGGKIYDDLAGVWADWITGTENQKTFKKAGYFSTMIGPKMKMIILNSVLYLVKNNISAPLDDPGSQYVWLRDQLKQARDNKQVVHIGMHLPLGRQEFRPLGGGPSMVDKHNRKLLSILEEYADITAAMYAAHLHFDSFRLIYKDGKPQTVMYVMPSVTPYLRSGASNKTTVMLRPRNPSFRRVYYDKSSLALTDYNHHYMPLTKSNSDQKPLWAEEYIFKNAYELNDMSAASLEKLVKKFREPDSALFEKYYKFNAAMVDEDKEIPCDCWCKSGHVCGLQFSNLDQHDKCFKRNLKRCAISGAENLQASVVISVFILAFLFK